MLVIPIYNIAAIPHATLYFNQDFYKRMTGVSAKSGAEVVFVYQKEDIPYTTLDENSFYDIGVEGEVVETSLNGYISIKTHDRVNIKNIRVIDNKIEVETTERPDIEDLDDNEREIHLKDLKEALMNSLKYFEGGKLYNTWVMRIKSINEVIATSSSWLSISYEDKYNFIKTDSVKERLALYEKAIYENLELYKVSSQAQSAQNKEHEKIYREQAIKKQIDYLQKELDEMHPESVSDVRKFELALEKTKMNEDAYKEVSKAINRLKQEGQNSPEYGNLYNYVDFMLSLPWDKKSNEEIDLETSEKILDEDHYGLDKVKRRVLQQIAVMKLNANKHGSILLFVGPPGTGKTSIGKSIAKALKRKYVRVALGGVRDEADIRGHRRTYIGAMAGRIMDGINKAGSLNPVMVLDEIDKLTQSYNGDPASALLEVLDPAQNHTFTDHYANAPFDLSNVFFIATANSLETIPAPLLNRMEVIQFNGYSELEKIQIAKKHLIKNSKEEMNITDDMLQISDEVLTEIVRSYTMEGGVRSLKKRIDQICRYSAIKIVKGEYPIDVKIEDLKDYLDMRAIKHNTVTKNNKPGIITGLAYTPYGGDVLFIETKFTKGKGKIIITGKLGDVMKESVQIAISIVKSLYPEKSELFETNDLHVHVPAGATPKDGPSAGITLVSALSSLVNNKVVNSNIAMTGEVSLSENVMPIGGLPEKLMAAMRANVKTVFIPFDNIEDLEDVNDEIKNKLEIIPVKSVQEVLEKL